MTLGALVTEGFGTFGDVGHVVLDGFQSGQQTVIATILTEAFGTLTGRSPYIVTEGFGSGLIPPPTPTASTPAGGVRRKKRGRSWYWEDWPESNEKPEPEVIKQIYAEIMETAPIVAKERATKVVISFSDHKDSAIPKLKTILNIDWIKLAADYENARILTALWHEEQLRIDDEETWILLQ